MKTQTTLLSLAESQHVSGGVEPLSGGEFQPAPANLSPSLWVVGDQEFIGPKNPFGAPLEIYN